MKRLFIASAIFFSAAFSVEAKNNHFFYDDDAQTVSVLYSTLMGAEQKEEMLNAQLTVAETSSSLVVFGINAAESMNVTLNLADLSGKVLAEREFSIQNGSNYRTLNVSELPEGNYLLTIRQGNKKTQKLIGIVNDHLQD